MEDCELRRGTIFGGGGGVELHAISSAEFLLGRLPKFSRFVLLEVGVALGRVPPMTNKFRGGNGGAGELSRGGSSGASGACFTFGDVSPIEGSRFRLRGGSGGGSNGFVDVVGPGDTFPLGIRT